jgi:hypothetical protein
VTALPRFEEVARVRPVDLVAPDAVGFESDGPGEGALPQPAPYVGVVARTTGDRAALELRSGDVAIEAVVDAGLVALRVAVAGAGYLHRSRRHGRMPRNTSVDGLALTLTGTQATVFTRAGDAWTARARASLTDHDVEASDPAWLADLRVRASGDVGRVRAGAFGQLGLRDLRLVSNADGTPYSPTGRPTSGSGPSSSIFLTATSAGPGFFGTGHASVWELDPTTLSLSHRSDVFFRRGSQVYGDHAIHLLRDATAPDQWVVATSTWGDFVDPAVDHVHVELGRTSADLLTGRHVVETEPLHLPTTGLRSVGVWDPHLVHAGGEWLVGYVSARRYFDFHPVLATGPSLDRLTVRGAATGRRATEGTTVARVGGTWRVLASDGRDNRRRYRAAYPVFDLDLRQVDTLQAPYPTNLPWPTLVPTGRGMLLIGFDGSPSGGRLAGYGTHGAVVIAREVNRVSN